MPETVVESQPAPEPYAMEVVGAASVPAPVFETVTVCAAGFPPPASAVNDSEEGESPMAGSVGS